ncbi:10226_t:CDS:2 [Funneliformis mosseae]|uniref:10226_t:CDS:1 n=1 Tax=Funneliformis mosseae TaxID=27381 RepID=A0A9N9FZA7_FUNMO|nr:10226_t:CDS:2 [Funneliformis mosseae]
MNLLDKDLENENEEQLLQRKYIYWSKEEKIFVMQQLHDILNDGYQQLDRYIKTITKRMAPVVC